ncbi:MAG: SAM-dependent chlorinase/fluorinase [Chitinophagaceae bacterium]|nr:SAM-dependent chlorinase/fluorinase [Chitinophagaceae bacterium]
MALITLTSEMGHQDYLVSAVKATLLGIDPGFTIVDVSHSIPAFNYPQAAYVCRNAFKHFPEYSYHLVLVNLFDRKPEQLLLAFHQNQYILCADNGLLTMILEEKPEMIIGIPLKSTEKTTIGIAAAMGRVAHELVNGTSIKDIGVPDVSYLEKNPLRPVVDDLGMEGKIIFIDQFENVVVNITREEFERNRNGRKFQIIFKRDEVIDRISQTYADAPEGEKLALFNSAGYLEIAINKGNAAGLFGLKGYNEKNGRVSAILQNQLFYQTIRIHFEP